MWLDVKGSLVEIVCPHLSLARRGGPFTQVQKRRWENEEAFSYFSQATMQRVI